jgi:DNA-directed RNA polymerase specialized sigma24 family protein
MDSPGSITRCILDLEAGERRDEAARVLWDRYFAGLTRYAMRMLQGMHAFGGNADEEDAAVRAFAKVCRGIERGQLKPGGRVDLLKLLRWSVRGEAINQAKGIHRDRFDGVPPAPDGADPEGDRVGIDQIPGKELPPEFLLLAEEGCRRLLDLLGEEPLRRIALWMLIGHTEGEIARKLHCSRATVERKLKRIRRKWDHLAPGGPARPGPRNASRAEVAEDLNDTTVILRGLAGELRPTG